MLLLVQLMILLMLQSIIDRWCSSDVLPKSTGYPFIYYANTILRDIGVPSIATIAISLFKLVATPLAHSYCNVSIATASSIHISTRMTPLIHQVLASMKWYHHHQVLASIKTSLPFSAKREFIDLSQTQILANVMSWPKDRFSS